MLVMVCGALLIGVVAGLRAFTAPAVVSWAATRGLLGPVWGWVRIMGWTYTPWIFTALALFELVTDQLPSTPSRKVPIQFATRILMGALAGATIGAARTSLLIGMAAGAVGAVIGTFGGAAARGALSRAFGSDRPAAFIEDAVAIGLGIVVIYLP